MILQSSVTIRLSNAPVPSIQGTCDYHDDHDEFDEPRGNRCGEPATRIIHWRDGRHSLGCDEHADEIALDVPNLVRSISAIGEE